MKLLTPVLAAIAWGAYWGAHRGRLLDVFMACMLIAAPTIWFNRDWFLSAEEKAAGVKLKFSFPIVVSSVLALAVYTGAAMLFAGLGYFIAESI